jgi:hypothetical protein
MRPLIALLFCCFAPALYAAPPVRIEASYDMFTRGIKIAEITEKFTRTGDHYHIESITKPVGLLAVFKPDTLSVVSEGDITSQGLHPHSFIYKRSIEATKNTESQFDWNQSTLMLSDNEGKRFVPLPADAQDRLSALYQLHYVPLLHERKELTMQITDGRRLRIREYLISAGQMLTIPSGTLETLYLSTAPQETPWKTEIWLSVKDGNFPCKIILTEESGEKLSQVLTTLSITQ